MPGKIWTREKLLVAIRKMRCEGADLSASSVQKSDSALFSSARSRSHFGSWRAAVEAAGFDYDAYRCARQCWTRDKILDGIRQLHDDGEDLLDPQFKFKHRSLYLAACAKRYFGSWRRAVQASGLSHEKLRERHIWTKERILRTIKQMGHEGKPLGWAYIETHKPGIYRAARRKENFGSWAGALRAAGFDAHVSRATARREERAQMQLDASAEATQVETDPPEVEGQSQSEVELASTAPRGLSKGAS